MPGDEFIQFICERFQKGKKRCTPEIAQQITELVSGHPYYVQKLAFFVFEVSKIKITEKDTDIAFQILIDREAVVFETILQGLASKQISLLRALAEEPSKSILSAEYMKRHDLKSIGGIQAAIKKLSQLDYIERTADKVWQICDPVFSIWLRKIA